MGLLGLLLSVLLVVSSLSEFDWNPTLFVGFGEEALLTTQYAEERLEDELFLRARQGHDGKFFFVQANDPWLLDASANAAILDYPIYRSQRMLYPALAGGLGFLGPQGVVWGLLVVNVLAMTLGTWAVARIAVHLGGSALWGLAFVGNLGLLYALTSDTADIVAGALAFGALVFLYRDRVPFAAALLAAAVLTREVMIVTAIGVAVWLLVQRRRRAAVLVLGIPSLAMAAWHIYMRTRLNPEESSPDALSAPFVGLARAVPEWLDDTLVSLTGAVVLALIVIYLIRWVRSKSLLGWGFVGFVPLAAVLSGRVWLEIFDYTRALAPFLTAAVLLIFVESRVTRRSRNRPRSPSESSVT